jgi:hypothetical protein
VPVSNLNKELATSGALSPDGGRLRNPGSLETLNPGGAERKTKQEIDHIEHPQSEEDIERIVVRPLH